MQTKYGNNHSQSSGILVYSNRIGLAIRRSIDIPQEKLMGGVMLAAHLDSDHGSEKGRRSLSYNKETHVSSGSRNVVYQQSRVTIPISCSPSQRDRKSVV